MPIDRAGALWQLGQRRWMAVKGGRGMAWLAGGLLGVGTQQAQGCSLLAIRHCGLGGCRRLGGS